MKNADKPAKPVPGLMEDPDFNGLTKREYFAAMAMQGMQANPSYDEVSLEDMARVAADAAATLLAELERTS
ncbi:MAG: hypothetical protein ACQEUM_07090 [Pseudomonadota bacterium]